MNKSVRLACAAAVCISAGAGAASAMPFARDADMSAPVIENVAYRRHRPARVYRRHYGGVNPGAAFVGAAAGLIGAGIAASQGPYYYGYPAYGYGGYPYGYGGYGPYYYGW